MLGEESYLVMGCSKMSPRRVIVGTEVANVHEINLKIMI
jgi:hypothetical protein